MGVGCWRSYLAVVLLVVAGVVAAAAALLVVVAFVAAALVPLVVALLVVALPVVVLALVLLTLVMSEASISWPLTTTFALLSTMWIWLTVPVTTVPSVSLAETCLPISAAASP